MKDDLRLVVSDSNVKDMLKLMSNYQLKIIVIVYQPGEPTRIQSRLMNRRPYMENSYVRKLETEVKATQK